MRVARSARVVAMVAAAGLVHACARGRERIGRAAVAARRLGNAVASMGVDVAIVVHAAC